MCECTLYWQITITNCLPHLLDSAHPRQQVSRTLEYAYDDYVVAQALRLYIDYHQYKNKWYRNRNQTLYHDDDMSTSKCAINNADNIECQIFPVVQEEGNTIKQHLFNSPYHNISVLFLSFSLLWPYLPHYWPYHHFNGFITLLTNIRYKHSTVKKNWKKLVKHCGNWKKAVKTFCGWLTVIPTL